MPFAVTCPKCAARFRSVKERPLGKGVECPKCGEQFYVSADNQADLDPSDRPPTSAPPRGDDRPAVRRPRDEDDDLPAALPPDEDDDDPRPRRRPRDDESDDDRPRRKAGGRMKLVVLFAVLGVGLLGVAAAGYVLFLGGAGDGPPSRAAKRIKPQRDLPMDLLIYGPEKSPNLEYYNLTEIRQVKPLSEGREAAFKDKLPPGTEITLADIDAYCISRAGLTGRGAATTVAVRLTSAQKAADVVARLTAPRASNYYRPLAGVTPQVFVNTEGLRSEAVFRPAPDLLVFVRFSMGNQLDPKLIADLAGRSAATHQLAPETLECLREVSGYPTITFLAGSGSGGETRGQGAGRALTADGLVEHYDFRIYPGPAEAAAQAKAAKKIMLPHMKEKDLWVKGERYYVFTVETPRSDE